jgi:D-alanine--poly(phosphoribitol) ligase subunit 2
MRPPLEETRMATQGRIIKSIYKAIAEVNDQLPKNRKLKKSVDTVLYGKSEKLDSLGLVMLIVAAEQKVQEEFGAALTLANERALAQKNSPFKTVKTLANYISMLLKENGKG